MSEVKFVEVMGFRVFSDDLSKISINQGSAKVINTISPNSYGLAVNDPKLDHALKNSDYLVLDGVYFAVASLLLKGQNIKRNQGPDVFYHYMNRLEHSGGTAFFLGSSDHTLELIRRRAARDYPGIKVHTYSPPFKSEFTEEDNQKMIDAVNKVSPDVLFIGMTCPKQERWSIQHREFLKAGLIVCIGNVFDWFAGTQKSIHPLWFKLRVGWLVRIILRPEIFRRNIGNQMKFFADTLKLFFSFRKDQPGTRVNI
ncbi:MAG TPA: WecB/TagA/CpsF family glycosyltransferase [Chitinophagaceae bacterium]|nr:WecB/TagA/CpsF family glycosyltransferase [Chitinophagaceae bacterium]